MAESPHERRGVSLQRLVLGSYLLLAVQLLATVGAVVDVRLEDSVDLVPSLTVVLGAVALISYGLAVAAGSALIMRDSTGHGLAAVLGSTFGLPMTAVVVGFVLSALLPY